MQLPNEILELPLVDLNVSHNLLDTLPLHLAQLTTLRVVRIVQGTEFLRGDPT